jgi:DNA polymerase-3 subunit alpha/error-prone DNA polymerase
LFGRPKENFNLTSDICSLPGIEIIPSESLWEQLMRDYKFTGLSLNYHPLSLLRSHLTQANHSFRQKNLIPYVCSEQLSTLNNGTPVRVAGLLSIQQRPPTAKGFSFLTLEDETGFFNIVLTPQVYQAYRLTLLKSPLLEVQGVLEKCEGVINIKALKLFPLNWRP